MSNPPGPLGGVRRTSGVGASPLPRAPARFRLAAEHATAAARDAATVLEALRRGEVAAAAAQAVTPAPEATPVPLTPPPEVAPRDPAPTPVHETPATPPPQPASAETARDVPNVEQGLSARKSRTASRDDRQLPLGDLFAAAPDAQSDATAGRGASSPPPEAVPPEKPRPSRGPLVGGVRARPAPSAATEPEPPTADQPAVIVVTPVPATPPIQGAAPWTAEEEAWLVPLGEVAPVFEHIYRHGSISEEGIMQLLGGPRAARRFANDLETHAARLPFRVRIDATESTRRYVKEG